MKTVISWWNLSASDQTIETLRTYLINEGISPWQKVDGLRLKFWISDQQSNRWGAVMLFDDNVKSSVTMPPNRATELIGYPPTERMSANIEAIIEGFCCRKLLDRGLAFESTKETL